MQLTALRAAADAGRWAGMTLFNKGLAQLGLVLIASKCFASVGKTNLTPDNIAASPFDVNLTIEEFPNHYVFHMSAILPVEQERVVSVILVVSDSSSWVAQTRVQTQRLDGRDHWEVSVRRDALAQSRVAIDDERFDVPHAFFWWIDLVAFVRADSADQEEGE